MGQKLCSKLFFIYSPNSDGFYIFYISQGSVATQLRCGGMFSNHSITNFPQNAPVKKIWESVNISQRYGQNFVAYFFEPHCICSPLWPCIALSLTIRPKFAIECLDRQIIRDFGAKSWEEGVDQGVSQILTRSRRDTGCRHLQPFEHNARTWQTDRQTDKQTTER